MSVLDAADRVFVEFAWKEQRRALNRAIEALGQETIEHDPVRNATRRAVFDALDEWRNLGRALGLEF